MNESDQTEHGYPSEWETILSAYRKIILFWLPGIFSIICLLSGIGQRSPELLAIAFVGLLFTFLGWCFSRSRLD